MMEERDKKVIKKNYFRLVRELDITTELLSYLYQEDTLCEEDKEKIKAKKTSRKKAEKLFKIIKKRDNGLKMLIKALIETKIQDYLAFELLDEVAWSEKEKNDFKSQINGKLDTNQVLKAEIAALKREKQELTSKCSEYESMIKSKADGHISQDCNSPSLTRKSSGRSSIFSFLKRKTEKKNVVVASELAVNSKAEQSSQTDDVLWKPIGQHSELFSNDTEDLKLQESGASAPWNEHALPNHRQRTDARNRVGSAQGSGSWPVFNEGYSWNYKHRADATSSLCSAQERDSSENRSRNDSASSSASFIYLSHVARNQSSHRHYSR